MDYCVIFCTAPSQDEADKIAAAVLENRAASCVQMRPIESLYHWKGKIEREKEIHLLLKTKDSLYPKAESLIRANHSYEVPQIVKLPISGGLPEYLKWVSDETA